MRYELDAKGYFICDLPGLTAVENWTADAPPQPIGVPRYLGASYNQPSGEWFGGHWVDEGFADLAPSAQELLAQNNALYEQAVSAITANYPQREKDTWPTQDNEVKAWVADPVKAITPWIDRAAATRGLSRDEYLRRTLVKVWQFEVISAYLTGIRQRYEDVIKLGVTPVFDYSIPASLQLEIKMQSASLMSLNPAEVKEAS